MAEVAKKTLNWQILKPLKSKIVTFGDISGVLVPFSESTLVIHFVKCFFASWLEIKL